jgi:hypothetical protein
VKVLVSTGTTQGACTGDFCWCDDGELVFFGSRECISPERCGCGRAFTGIDTRKATTTAKVLDIPMSEAGWVARYRESHRKAWEEDDALGAELVASVVLGEAARYEEGSILRVAHGKVFMLEEAS